MRRRPPLAWTVPLLCAVALASSHPSAYAAKIGVFVGLATLQAMSLNMIWGFGGQFSMGQMMLTAIGAYVSAIAVSLFGVNPYLALVPALAASAAVTLLLGGLALRLRGFYFSIVTLAFAQICLVLIYNADVFGGPSGMVVTYSLPDIRVGGALLLAMDAGGTLLLAGGIASLLMLGQSILLGSPAGRAIVAVREEEVLARSLGISPTRYKILAFLLSSIPACVAGWLSAPVLSYLSTSSFGLPAQLDQICAVVIGGTGTVLGPLLGAAIVVVLPEVLRFAGAMRLAGYSGVLILTVIFVPRGIAGLLASFRKPGEPVARLARQGRPAALPARHGTGALLQVDAATKRYAGLTAVSSVTLTIAPGEVVGLIGPNGAGKTTLFDMISGFARPSDGTIRWRGVPVGSPEALARDGLVRTFQHARLFPNLTVRENLLTATHLPGKGLLGDGGGRERVARALEICRMQDWAEVNASELPYGLGKRLGVALGLIAEPEMLMLDEPAAGLAGAEREELAELLGRIGRLGVALLVIEHDIGFVASVCRRVVVLAAGQVICDGSIEQVRADSAVVEAYLGTGHAHQPQRPEALPHAAG